MSGIDGALADEYTMGINAPSNGQQGYFTLADQQAPRPNLAYQSPAAVASQLKLLIGQAADGRTAPGATIAASGSISLTFSFATTPYALHEFHLRCIVRVGTTLQYAARVRLAITTNAAGAIVASSASTEFSIGSGFSISSTAAGGATTVGLTVNSSTGSVANVMASITETYADSIT